MRPIAHKRRILPGGRLVAAFRSFIVAQRGDTMIEFALIMPVIVALMICTYEVSHLVRTQHKMERVAGMVGNLVARAESHTEENFQACFDAASQFAWPYDLFENGNVIVTSIVGQEDGEQPTVLWQQVSEDGVTVESRVGSPGEAATLPGGLNIDEGQGMIVTEVYFDYAPRMAEQMFPARRLYMRAHHSPRRSAIITM